MSPLGATHVHVSRIFIALEAVSGAAGSASALCASTAAHARMPVRMVNAWQVKEQEAE